MAKLGKEIMVETGNKVGTLARVTAPLKEAGVNIQAMCGWGEGEKGCIMLVTNNNAKGLEALKKAGFQGKENEVVLVEIEHRVGSLAEAAQKLSEAGVNINYCYVSATQTPALAVVSTADNKKAVAALG